MHGHAAIYKGAIMTPEQAVLFSVGICVAGAVLTLLVSKSKSLAGWLAFFTTVATAALIVPAVVRVLASGPANPHHPQELYAAGGYAMRFYVDGLSAIFLLLAVVIAVLAALYSIEHLKKYQNKSAASYYPLFLLFVGGMYGVLATTDMMFFFFAFWQLMTLPSFLLVRFESEKPENAAASWKYLIFMEVACAAAMIGASLLAGHGELADPRLKYDFDVISEGIPALLAVGGPGALTGALAFFLLGFGIKIGMWPFGQFWAPDAYSAAPSPVTSLIAGVMAKTGVYGLLRTFLWLVPLEAKGQYNTAFWGCVLAILGTITLFTANMQGLKQTDSKRLLAFSSISQLGYILFAIGTCVALMSSDNPALVGLATLAFCGAVLHAVNHGIFKGLLFFNAGTMFQATGTQDLNKMGGLWKYMPLTGFTVLIASFGISGVPLLNGFVSKWAIYVAAVRGTAGARYLAVCAIVAILTSALTLALYMKFFGAAFLSRSSQLVKEQAAKQGTLEVGFTQQLPQLILAALCVAIGLAPGVAFRVLGQVLNGSRQGFAEKLADSDAIRAGAASGLNIGGTALYIPLAIAVVIAIAFLVAYTFSKLGGSVRRTGDIWLCGYAREKDCYRYGASNFYGEIHRHFKWLGANPRAKVAAVKEN
jgi:formate hydrogenlyase subunit 3/multisubunit Na+/H+ antiporter MnhD subunit